MVCAEPAADRAERIRVGDLVIDWGVQPRNGPPDPETVEAYARDLAAGDKLPPAVVFRVGGENLLVDGRNRRDAHVACGEEWIDCVVREGTREEAIVFAAACNTRHGRTRSREDLEKALENLFSIPEFAARSDREVASVARCHWNVVGAVRRRLVESGVLAPSEKSLGKDGRLQVREKKAKPKVKVDGKEVAETPPDVERILSGKNLPEGAVVEVVTHRRTEEAEPERAPVIESPEPFDPEQTDLGQLLPSQPGKNGELQYGPSMRAYAADSRAYMDPVLYEWLHPDDRVREAAARHISRARKACNNDLPPFLLRLEMLLKVRDVASWKLCEEKNGGCGGAGQLPGSGTCSKCRGWGYRV